MSNRNSMAAKRTVLAKFRSQLNELMSYIEQTSVRYIRCIKPNSGMKPRIINHKETMNQLESAGLVTAITISRETFPNRLKYDIIWERFLCLYEVEEVTGATKRLFSINHSFSFTQEQLKENVKKMLSILLTEPFIRSDGARVPSFSCGKTKVYFRTGGLEYLEQERMNFYSARAEIIQTWFRCHSIRWKYQYIRRLIIRTQARVRGVLARTLFSRTKVSAVMIQSTYRGFVRRSSFIKKRTSTILVQTWFRCHIAQLKYNTSRKLILACQARVKSKRVRRAYLKIRALVIKVQTQYRGFKARKMYNERRSSAILIQAFLRGRRDFKTYQKMRRNVVLIQSIFRAALAVRYQQTTLKSAVKIQSCYRTHVEMRSYKQKRDSSIIIQSYVRGVHARKFASSLKQFKKAFSETQDLTRRANQIQCWYRWHAARKCFGNLKTSVVILQARHRGALLRTPYNRSKMAAITIQKVVRSFLTRISVIRMRLLEAAVLKSAEVNTGATVIQRWYRCHNIRSKYNQFRLSVVMIQARCRGAKDRVIYRQKQKVTTGATTIQKLYRSHKARSKYNHLRRSVISIQARHRGAKDKGMYREKLNYNAAATTIQKMYRCHCIHSKYNQYRRSVVMIQARYRGGKDRERYYQQRKAIIIIQSFVRMIIQRMDYLLQVEIMNEVTIHHR